MKKVSLILTTYNCKDNLQKTLDSIERQNYPNIEVVIKDGGSVDGTLDIIEKYSKYSCNQVKWISKKDTGIYDAMNQGYMMCTGDIVAFFNDLFIGDEVISKLVKKIEELNPDTGKEYIGVHADLVYTDGEKIVRKWQMGNKDIRQGWMPGHPTLYLKREIYEKYGIYNTNFRIAADYEFMIRFLKEEDNKLAYLPETVISMFYGGTSNGGLKNYILSLVEGHRALKMNKIKYAWLIDCKRTIRVLFQFIK